MIVTIVVICIIVLIALYAAAMGIKLARININIKIQSLHRQFLSIFSDPEIEEMLRAKKEEYERLNKHPFRPW